MKLYVGNLSFDMTERTLRELFEHFGALFLKSKLITDREAGQFAGLYVRYDGQCFRKGMRQSRVSMESIKAAQTQG